MATKEMLTEQHYAELIKDASSVLKLSLSQIKEKFVNYPICLMDYIEKDILEKSIEIRFDKERITLTCTFNDKDECDSVFLFSDNDTVIEQFVRHLTNRYDYCFVRCRFALSECFVKIRRMEEQRSNTSLMFYQ